MTPEVSALRAQLDRGLHELSPPATAVRPRKSSVLSILLITAVVSVLLVLILNTRGVQHENSDPLFQLF